MKDFSFKKSLGQNFLIDNNVIKKIVEGSDILPNSLIIEIGPGAGALTKELVKTENQVLAFEIDKRLESELAKITNKNFAVVFEDFLKVDVLEYLKKYNYKQLFIVGNLPYYITTPIITKVIEEIPFYSFTIMVQKEVGDRLKAKPNSKDYNSLSVFAQYKYKINKICDVSKNCFIPKPNVDSIVLNFREFNRDIIAKNEKLFFKLVRDAFKFKRKNLKNNLKEYDLDKLNEILKKLDKDLSYRAEQISIEEFILISNNLF